jgi:hypothetical protein
MTSFRHMVRNLALVLICVLVVSDGFLSTGAVSSPPTVPLHPGLRVFTHKQDPSIKNDAIGLRFRCPLSYPLAENLRDLLLQTPPVYHHAVLELDSEGGELSYLLKLIEVLGEVRKRTEFTTRVMGGGICASGCIAAFMQGTKRKASGASVWVFHGACSAYTNVPDLDATERYLGLLESSGVKNEFLCRLRDQGYVTQPGNFFLSGYELFKIHDAGIITELLPSWQPEDPMFPPALESR